MAYSDIQNKLAQQRMANSVLIAENIVRVISFLKGQKVIPTLKILELNQLNERETIRKLRTKRPKLNEFLMRLDRENGSVKKIEERDPVKGQCLVTLT